MPPPGVALEMGGDALAQQLGYPKKTIYLDLGQVSHDLGRPLFPRPFDLRLVDVARNGAFMAATFDVVGPLAESGS